MKPSPSQTMPSFAKASAFGEATGATRRRGRPANSELRKLSRAGSIREQARSTAYGLTFDDI
jgi:hypothetical protein